MRIRKTGDKNISYVIKKVNTKLTLMSGNCSLRFAFNELTWYEMVLITWNELIFNQLAWYEIISMNWNELVLTTGLV